MDRSKSGGFRMFQVLATFSLVALMALPSAAQDVVYFSQGAGQIGGAMPMPGPFPPMPFPALDEAIANVQKALNLSETQVTALKALLNQRNESSKTAFLELAEKQKALHAILGQQNPAAIDIGNAYLAVHAAQNSLNALEQKFQTDFRALLSADQRTTLQNLQNASNQIESLRMLGVLEHDRIFTRALPAPGIGPLPGIIGTGPGQIRILRRNEVAPR
jgi:hypothetical protein